MLCAVIRCKKLQSAVIGGNALQYAAIGCLALPSVPCARCCAVSGAGIKATLWADCTAHIFDDTASLDLFQNFDDLMLGKPAFYLC